VFLLTSVAMTWIALGQSLLLDALDLILVYLTSVTAVAAAGLWLGGWRGASHWSLLAGLKSALANLLFQLPALFALGVVLVSRGSLASREVASAQGPWPWSWNAFASPMLLIACFSFVATCLPEASRRAAPVNDGPTQLDHRTSRSVMYLAEWTQLWIVATLTSVVFLGGASIPQADDGPPAWIALLLGAAWLQLKAWGVVAAVLWLRWSVLRVRPDELLGVWLRWLVPFSSCALVLASAHAAVVVNGALPADAERATSTVVFAVVVVLVSYFVFRIVRASRAGAAPPSLNPWL
jgi:NADH-quinone oxidoreductase subunit H